MRKTIMAALAGAAALALAALMPLAPALAGGAYVEAVATVAAEDLDNYADSVSGRFGLGLDFGRYRLAAEYEAGRAGADSLVAMGYADFGEGAFQPFLGIGAGAWIEDTGSLEFGAGIARLSAGVSYGLGEHARLLAGYSHTAGLRELEDGEGVIFAGLRVGF